MNQKQYRKLKKKLKERGMTIGRYAKLFGGHRYIGGSGNLYCDENNFKNMYKDLIINDKKEEFYGRITPERTFTIVHKTEGHPVRILEHLSKVVELGRDLKLEGIPYEEIPSRKVALELIRKAMSDNLEGYLQAVLEEESR